MNWDSEKIREDAQNRRGELHARLAQIPAEKKKLDDEIQAIKRELIGLDQVLDGLEVMTSGPVPMPEPEGFTDKIRKLLSETSVPLVPTQIRDALEQAGVTASSPKNLLISVHTVLERIDEELEKIKRTSDGKIAYKRKLPWVSVTCYLDEAGNVGRLSDLAGKPSTPIVSKLMAPRPPRSLRRPGSSFASGFITGFGPVPPNKGK